MTPTGSQCLVSEVGLPAPRKKSVEGKPYQAGKNLSKATADNIALLLEISTSVEDSGVVDSETIIDDLIMNLRMGGKVTW